MSGPEDGRGDAFDDFFGDPTPSGRMSPAGEGRGPEITAGDERTRDTDQAEGHSPEEPVVDQPTQPAVTGAVPESWWDSQAEAPAAPVADATWQTQAAAAPAPQPSRQPRRGVSALGLVAMLVGGVLLGGLLVGGVVMALGGDDEPVASQTTVTETSDETSDETSEEPPSSTSTPPSTSSSTSSSSSSTSSSSSSSSPTRSGELPAGVTNCAGPTSGTSVGRATEVTSCDFAVAVRQAYLSQSSQGDVSLEVTSPVTNESYSMSCSGEDVTRCTGGNNAVVVLY